MKNKSFNYLKEEEKKKEKIDIWILIIMATILIIWSIYGWFNGEVARRDAYPGSWFYKRSK